MELWSAFLIGMAGSLHCAGMCGPLLVALPVNSKSRLSFFTGRILYNAGRMSAYIFLGLIFGTFGSAASMFGVQKNISVLLGAVVIFLVIIPGRYKNKMTKLPVVGFYNRKLQFYIGKLLKRNSAFTLFMLGTLNGLLPCGLVYLGLLGAVTAYGLIKGMLYMGLFGLGTLPLMFTISLMGHYIKTGIRKKLGRVVPFLALLFGTVLILRGLDLGIPYLSPRLPIDVKTSHMNFSRLKPPVIKPAVNRPNVEDCCK